MAQSHAEEEIASSKEFGDLAGCLRLWARRWPSVLAAADETSQLTFAELDRTSALWARACVAAGVGPGTRVGLWAGNGPHWLVRAFGVWRAGATLVPLSTFLTRRELSELMGHASLDALLLDRRVGQRDLVAIYREASAADTLRPLVVHGDTGQARHGDFQHEAGFLRSGRADRSLPCPAPSDVAVVLYTSGTTGRPKGVRLTHGSILATVIPTAMRGGLQPGDRVLSSLPLFWVAGLVIRALPTLAAGSGLIFSATFQVEQYLALLRRYRPNGLHLRPPQVASLLAHPEFDPELLAAVSKGGGRIAWYHPYLQEARLITGYGMTEMSGYVTCTSFDDPLEERERGIGSPLPGVEIRIVDAEGEPVGAGTTGEIRVLGPGLFAGYDGSPRGMGLDSRGFFCTGDLGHLDSNGKLHFTGRMKDLLRVKGVNVSPVEVEEVLARHPSVEAAYVVGLPADGLDQELVALVVARGSQEDEQAWREWCARELSPFKRPSRYVVVRRDELTFGPTTKPQRAELARLARERLGG